MNISKLTTTSLLSIGLLIVLLFLFYFFKDYQKVSELIFLIYIYLGLILFPIIVIAFIGGIIKKSREDIVLTSVALLLGILQVLFSLLVIGMSQFVGGT